jgi:predicted TIM-barrel fold metal-dependent hydrolase
VADRTQRGSAPAVAPPDRAGQHAGKQREEPAMQIIDAQVHIWSSGTPSGHHRQTPVYTAEELIGEMDAADVHGAVLHPPSWDPDSNEVAVEAARKYPDRFCILGWFPLDQPASRSLVATWKQRPGMLGLRWALIRPEQQTWHEDGTMDWLWPAAEQAGTPVATMAGRFLPKFRQIAEQYPRLRLLIDHLGLVRAAQDDAAFANLDALLALADLPNVAVKATGAPGYSTAPYPFRNIHDGLHRIFDAYGPHRFFWGTDLTRMPCSYRQCVTMFTEELPWLKGRDLELVMGEGVRDWLGWK